MAGSSSILPNSSAPPPRNDLAQEVVWNLEDHAGQPVRVEIVDADDGAAARLEHGTVRRQGIHVVHPSEELARALVDRAQVGVDAGHRFVVGVGQHAPHADRVVVLRRPQRAAMRSMHDDMRPRLHQPFAQRVECARTR